MENHYCAILGFSIDRETACVASGDHPLCRKCRGRNQGTRTSGSGKRKARKRCQCGRGFISRSNRQRFCEKCGERAERRRKTEWEWKKRRDISVSGRLGAKKINGII